jgi:putative ABC transport system permease protein
MLRNYLSIALRSVRRNLTYSFINIVGLAVGLACVLLIGLHIADDLSFDRFHAKADRIYRFTQATPDVNLPSNSAPAWAGVLKAEVPQVESTTRLYSPYSETLVARGETKFYEGSVRFADPNFFTVFDFSFAQGNPRTALAEPSSVVLTESAAKRYFGAENPLGKTLRFDNKNDLKVTGVMRDVPQNSHVRFDMLGSMATIEKDNAESFKSFFWNPFYTYVLLRENARVQDVEPLLWRIKGKYMKDIPVVPGLQPLTSIHMVVDNARSTVYFLAAIGAVLLLIACINYTNLATARFLGRSREVGVRKTLGATRGQVAAQFLSETFVLTLIAFVLAVVIAEATMPLFAELTGKKLSLFSFSAGLGAGLEASAGAASGQSLTAFSTLVVLASMLGLIALVSVLAGLYPALFLSRFRPVTALRGASASGGKGAKAYLRSTLVVVQFAVSVAMIIATFVVQRQLSFIQSKNLGFDREQVVLVSIRGEDDGKEKATVVNAFKQTSGVRGVTLSSTVPGKTDLMVQMPIEFKYLPSGDKDPNIKWICADEQFLSLYGVALKEGRNLNGSDADKREGFLLNEAAVRKLKWENNPLGREIGYSVGEAASGWHIEKHGRVIGVVKDFNAGTLRKEIEPLLIHVENQFMWTISVKLAAGNPASTLAQLEAAWKRTVPNRPFVYTFLDDDFNAVYQRERRLQSTIAVFAGLAVFVSCLGLLGLAAFAAESRTKEIGIRKVLGASVANIIALLSTDFLKLVLAAIIVAVPLAYWAAGKWLQDFAYRAELSWWVFAGAGVLAVIIAFATVASQAWRAARANPVEALRSE